MPGRKSGQPRSTPMTPFEHDGGALHRRRAIPAPTGRPTPAPRARARSPAVDARDRSGSSSCRPTSRDRYCARSREKVPVGVGFAKRSGLVVDGTPDEFEALAGRLAVFRFDPA